MAPPSRAPASGARHSSSPAAVKKPAHAAALAAVSNSAKRIKKPAPVAALAAVSSKSIKKTARPPTSPPVACSGKKQRAGAAELMAPPAADQALAVHPVRRLPCGTAVVARTKLKEIREKLWLVSWLPARVVSASGADHYVVKYAAELDRPQLAGKVVRLPVKLVKLATSSAFRLHCRQPSTPPPTKEQSTALPAGDRK